MDCQLLGAAHTSHGWPFGPQHRLSLFLYRKSSFPSVHNKFAVGKRENYEMTREADSGKLQDPTPCVNQRPYPLLDHTFPLTMTMRAVCVMKLWPFPFLLLSSLFLFKSFCGRCPKTSRQTTGENSEENFGQLLVVNAWKDRFIIGNLCALTKQLESDREPLPICSSLLSL